jgi:hypothetical protein
LQLGSSGVLSNDFHGVGISKILAVKVENGFYKKRFAKGYAL